jgi:isopenicillin-N N-acyltransferase-like protein
MKLTVSGGAPVVHLQGSSYQQGLYHGRAFADIIRLNIDHMHEGVRYLAERGRSYDYQEIARRSYRYALSRRPQMEDELRGIAVGSGVDFDDILMHNFPVFVMGSLLPMECTQVLVPGSLSVDGQTRLAKTRDVKVDRMRNVLLHRELDDGREVIEATLAGSIEMIGSSMNSDGLMLTTSGIWSRRTVIDFDRADSAWLGSTLDPIIQDAHSVDEAERLLRAEPRLTNLNVVASDASGAAAALEITPDEIYRHDSANGVVIRTNHFFTESLRGASPTRDEYESTYHRYDTAVEAFSVNGSEWSDEALWSLLSSHDGYPADSVCRHRQGDAGGETTYGSVSSWPRGTMDLWIGHPCERVLEPAAAA